MSLESLFHQVISQDRPFYHYPLYWMLCWVSWAYALGQGMRAWAYRCGILRTRRLPVPVISVGNLTLGGTGKTPTVLWLAGVLKEMGRRPAILSRGYGGDAQDIVNVVSDGDRVLLEPEEGGDEPVMLARRLPGVPVLAGRRRFPLGQYAVDRFQADVMILDDGFQHLALGRDLNLLLLDHRAPLGNGHLFPAGTLREVPQTAAKRANAALVTRWREDAPEWNMKELLGFDLPLAASALVPDALVSLSGEGTLPLDGFSGTPLSAFCGIAQPDDFFNSLEALGMELVDRQAFPDHFDYSAEVLRELVDRAIKKGAQGLITTEKDAVKLGRHAIRIPVWSLRMRLRIIRGEADLIERVRRCLDEGPAAE